MPTHRADVFDVELELAVSSIFGLEAAEWMESFAEAVEEAEETIEEWGRGG